MDASRFVHGRPGALVSPRPGKSPRVGKSPRARKETKERPPNDGIEPAKPQRPWAKQSGDEPLYVPLNMNDDVEKARGPVESSLVIRKEEKMRTSKAFDDEESIRTASAKMTASLESREEGICRAESSVYGAALVIPQLARSAGWPKSLTILSIRSYIFLFLNICVQGSILTLIAKEEYVMEPFAGEMYLCDFGSRAENAKGDRGRGPGGTEFTISRIYDFQTWQTRRYVEKAFLKLFPEKAKEIEEHIDPGEFGMENYYCRILCCMVFMTTCLEDLMDTMWMARLIWAVPNQPESWIMAPESSEDSDPSVVYPYDELDNVHLRLAGMPIIWKVLAMITICMPKVMLWKLTITAGTTFLFETGGIEDVIVNSVALTFILGIDELMFENLMSTSVRAMIDKIEPYPLHRASVDESITLEELMRHYDDEFRWWGLRDIAQLFPMKVLLVLGLCLFTLGNYYARHCILEEGAPIIGGFVSKPIHLPLSPHLNFLNAFFPNFFPVDRSESAFWTMPEMPSPGESKSR